MSTRLPRLVARISAQERFTAVLHARIEELSRDMNASFKLLTEYQIATERKIEARFDKVEAQIDEIKDQMATKEDVAALGVRIDKVEERMATKEDVAALEARMLDAFKQLVVMIDERLPPKQ